MNPLRSLTIRSKLAVSLPFRQKKIRRLSEANQAPMSVVFYHRVADEFPNPWTISTRDFERHVEFCRTNFELISLAEVQRRLDAKESPRPTVTFTFDDGYADNCRYALPLMIRHRIPCTYFATTENVRKGTAFRHDLDRNCRLPINTAEELVAAADAGIEIGLHTANHVDFNLVHTQAEMNAEIIDAKRELEDMIGRDVRYFAVPFGMPEQMRPAVFEAARRCGFKWCLQCLCAYNLVGNDSFHIRRFHGDPEFVRLRNWLSFDERKVRNEPKTPPRGCASKHNHNKTPCPSTKSSKT